MNSRELIERVKFICLIWIGLVVAYLLFHWFGALRVLGGAAVAAVLFVFVNRRVAFHEWFFGLWWKFRRGQARSRALREEKEQRIALDTRNREIFYLQSFDSPHLMMELDRAEFEDFVLRYFRLLGYEAQGTNATNDDGFQGLLRYRGQLYLVRCEQLGSKDIDEAGVQDFLGEMNYAEAVGGFYVSTSCFTPAAVGFAKGKNVTLIDGAEFVARIMSFEVVDPGDSVLGPDDMIFS